MSDQFSQFEVARLTGLLRESVIRRAISSLRLPSGSSGLDAGCGVGLQAMMLAESIGADGHVTGLDQSRDYINHAKSLVTTEGLSNNISFTPGDVRNLPFDDDYFDWAWSADCIGYAPFEPLPLLREIVRVVRPGGIIALLAWTHETLLPGYPLLETHLRATAAGIAPFTKDSAPALHFLRALGWYRETGLKGLEVRTFAGDAHAPLNENEYQALKMLFSMRWPGVESELLPDDRMEYQQLCSPESPDFILDSPDYYAFFTYSMFFGTVAK